MKKCSEEYQAQTPDTLDLAHRAELALNGLKGTSDPNDGYLMYIQVGWCTKTPNMIHTGCDIDCAPKWLDDYQLMRVASGNEDYREYEDGLLETMLGFVSMDDGFYYANYDPKRPWVTRWFGEDDFALLNMGAVGIITLITRNDLEDGHEPMIERMCRTLVDSAIDKGAYAYYPEDFSTYDKYGRRGGPYTIRRGKGWHTDHDPVLDEHAGPEGSVIAYTGHQIRALAMWAQRTQNEEYLDMAGKLARGVLRPCFWGNPNEPVMVKGAEHGYVDSHFHSRGQALRGVLEYGLVSGDEGACNFVREFCEYTRAYGINQVGWIPCWPNLAHLGEFVRTMEGCFIGDLLAMYSKLSENGYGSFWDDMDRLIRNTMAEAQFTDVGLIERVIENSPDKPPFPQDTNWDRNWGLDDPRVLEPYPGQIAYDDIARRMVGTFGSNIELTGNRYDLLQCCTCNAVRGIFYAWDDITRQSGEGAVINLLLNRSSEWLDIDSYLPYEGRVVIKNKTSRCISVRIPSYVNIQKLVCRLRGVDIRPFYSGRYLSVDGLAPGDTIELLFPLKTQDYSFTINGNTPHEQQVSFSMKANTVLDISPRDLRPTTYPFYQREHMKAEKAPIHTATRRVSPVIPRV